MNKSHLRYLLVFLAALIVQSTVVKYLEIVHWRPDLLLIILVMYAVQYGRKLGSTAGFLVGVSSDLISGGLLGLGALSKTITGFIAGGVSRLFQERSQFIFTLFLGGLIHDLIYFYINTLGKEVAWRVIWFVHIIPNLFYTAIVGMVIYYFAGRWLKADD